MRFLLLMVSLFAGSLALGAACSSEEATKPNADCPGPNCCEPNLFTVCRCPNNEEGSRQCNDQGTEFGECAINGRECPETTGEGGNGAGASSSTGNPGPGGAGGSGGSGGAGDRGPFEPCTENNECKSTLCSVDGYCTNECATFMECAYEEPPFPDCPGGVAQCAPTCGSTQAGINPHPEDCTAFGLKCGFTKATDGLDILVCAKWPDGAPLPPDGTECDPTVWDNLQCNLGNTGTQAVCQKSQGVCVYDQCYGDEDCPDGMTCDSDGSFLGSCGS